MNNPNPPPLLAVRAFIIDEDGKVLILKRAANDEYGDMWCLPGGKVDYGQTAEEAIVREVQEETSLECTSTQFLFYLDGLPEKIDYKHYLTLFFVCKVIGNIKLNHESSTYNWIWPEMIKDFRLAFRNDVALVKYWKFL